MAIIASKPKSEYSTAPEGLWPGVCCDVVDLGMQETGFDGKKAHKVQIRWMLEEVDPKTQKNYMVMRSFRLSLHEKASLRAILESWRGRKFTNEELEGFDLEVLVGVNAQVQVIHNIKDGGETYANVQAVVPPARNAVKMRVPDGYVRVSERDRQADDPFGGAMPNDEEAMPF